MAIERIPCGGWDIDNTTFAFVNSGKKKVLTVIAGSQSDPSKLPLTGGSMLGPIELEEGAQPTQPNHVVDKQYVDDVEEGLNQTISSLDTEVNGIQSNVSILQSDVSDIQSDVSDLQDVVVDLQDGIENTIKKDGTTTTTVSIPFAQGIDLQNQKATNMATPTQPTDGANKQYVDDTALGYLKITGGALTGTLSMSNQSITNLAEPTNNQDATTRNYVDNKVTSTLLLPRIRDLFGVAKSSSQTIVLPDTRQNILIVFYSVDPSGNANISNSKAVSVPAGSTKTQNNLTINFSSDGKTLILTNADTTNAMLGQYYGYNNT